MIFSYSSPEKVNTGPDTENAGEQGTDGVTVHLLRPTGGEEGRLEYSGAAASLPGFAVAQRWGGLF